MTGKQFAVIMIITFIAGFVWLISDIIFNTKPSIPISPKEQSLIEPVNPNFSQRVLDEIEQIPDPRPRPSIAPPIQTTPLVSTTSAEIIDNL